jgi:hypothetical protein
MNDDAQLLRTVLHSVQGAYATPPCTMHHASTIICSCVLLHAAAVAVDEMSRCSADECSYGSPKREALIEEQR